MGDWWAVMKWIMPTLEILLRLLDVCDFQEWQARKFPRKAYRKFPRRRLGPATSATLHAGTRWHPQAISCCQLPSLSKAICEDVCWQPQDQVMAIIHIFSDADSVLCERLFTLCRNQLVRVHD